MALKNALTTAPVLTFTNFDKPFVIESDTSKIRFKAVLIHDGHPLAYKSRSLV